MLNFSIIVYDYVDKENIDVIGVCANVYKEIVHFHFLYFQVCPCLYDGHGSLGEG